MSTPSSSSAIQKIKKIALAFVLASVLSGLILYALVHFEYGARPEVYNVLGLNPTAQWVGQDAPDFTLKEMRTGRSVSLRSLRGKVVLLDFWASWCGSCRKQLPMIEKLHKDPKLSPFLRILSINMKEVLPPQGVVRLLKEKGYTFPVLKGSEAIVKKYRIWFFPALVLIDRKGKVFYSAAELHDEKKIRAWIQKAASAS